MQGESCQLHLEVLQNKDLITRLNDSGIVNFFLLNLDNFSNINNAYGYNAGNSVLMNVAKYMNIVKPATADLYKFSSDKFVLIDGRSLDKDALTKIAESILSFFSHTEIIVDKVELKISMSIGISTAQGLINIKQSEMAIKELRKSKRNYFNFFNADSPFVKQEEENIYWILKIKEAVSEESIVAYFQPIINNHTNKIEKYECLARLKDEDKIISPYLFIEAAKVTGNLSYVTRSLIYQSFKKFSKTQYDFSLNITGEDLILDYLEDYLMKASHKFGVNPNRVVLEMLEGINSLDEGTTLKQLDSLREKGFKIAIDDFGAQSSNMSRLLEIKPDYLKIDGIFIKNIVDDEKSQIIVDAIIMICRRSGIKMIAEFIHNKEVQEKIKSLGIDYSQGYYFGKPSPDIESSN